MCPAANPSRRCPHRSPSVMCMWYRSQLIFTAGEFTAWQIFSVGPLPYRQCPLWSTRMFIGSRISVTRCFSAIGAARFSPSMVFWCICSCVSPGTSSPATTVISGQFSCFATSQPRSIALTKASWFFVSFKPGLKPHAVNWATAIFRWAHNLAIAGRSFPSCGQNSIAGKPRSADAAMRSRNGSLRNHISQLTANLVCGVLPGVAESALAPSPCAAPASPPTPTAPARAEPTNVRRDSDMNRHLNAKN